MPALARTGREHIMPSNRDPVDGAQTMCALAITNRRSGVHIASLVAYVQGIMGMYVVYIFMLKRLLLSLETDQTEAGLRP